MAITSPVILPEKEELFVGVFVVVVLDVEHEDALETVGEDEGEEEVGPHCGCVVGAT